MQDSAHAALLPPAYDPAAVEQKIYAFWERSGCFTAGRDPGKTPFAIVMPPPNVTGSLHLGHAWNNTLQDIIIRYKRMAGFDALYLPGTDHAGIATQTRVEKTLREESGLSRYDLGREAFVERVWAWKHRFGNLITNQIRALGASCDWSRERFTLDEGLSRAVRKVFVDLYREGLIYRGQRIINWCPRCATALSDIEVEHSEVQGTLYYVRYPLVNGEGEVVVATTRPETMFADVAVAVHPDDDRYQKMVGKRLRLPLTDREIPVIADSYVDPEYGSGCVKITPAHDPNDFEVGLRHQLEMPQCIGPDGRLTAWAGPYQGLTREAARAQVAADLAAQGYMVKEEALTHAVGHCSRCETVVEPYLSEQWFVRMQPLAEPALAALARGELRFIPDRFEKVFVHWLENVRDWCISRQLWWGHRIPAWYCTDCGGVTAAVDEPQRCEHCGSERIHQDEDVLDTWFSSALWPFSTLGWPDETGDYARYYPTHALVTAYDILFFWVARMVFTGLKFTGRMPFREVVVHGLIRAADGRKMSKSLGNGVDPLEVIDRYGADALRFTLTTGTSPGNDQRFAFEKVEGSRHFINKVWNAARFVLMNVPEGTELPALDRSRWELPERWILHRLNETIDAVTRYLDRYEFGEAGRVIYDFAWDDFCDWYIEFSKLALYGDDEARKQQVRAVLVCVLDTLLRLLHPFIPFVTEEIWQSLPLPGEALVTAAWPRVQPEWDHPAAAREAAAVMELVRAVRNLRAELNLPPSRAVPLVVHAQDDAWQTLFAANAAAIRRFCNVSTWQLTLAGEAPAQAVSAVTSGAQVYLPLAGVVDVATELERLRKEQVRLASELERAEKKLANPQFVAKAPAAVVAAEQAKADDFRTKLAALAARMELFRRV
ncbi:MAG: valine--tRNA ligase [Alicyclobacillus sp.]|nr:valine--tRNA ligase [Alicyclobacillus sp.]